MKDEISEDLVSIRMGHITYENKDNSEMNEQKQRFLQFREKYLNAGKFITTSLAILEYLYDSNHLDILNKYSPAFATCLNHNFIAQIVTQLNCFYSPNDDLSFNKFFNYLRANYNKIFTGDFYEYIDYGDEKETKHIVFSQKEILNTIEKCENDVNEHKNGFIKDLDTLRNNLYSHFSLDKKNKLETVKIKFNDLSNIWKFTEKIFNDICVMYDRIDFKSEPINSRDISGLIYVLNQYDKYKKNIMELDKQEKLKELGLKKDEE